MKSNTKILTLICFGMILLSMFLPFYESPRVKGIIPEDRFVIVTIYESPDFGLTLWVFNGFGSLFALTNLLLAITLVLSRFFFPKSLVTVILVTCIFVISLGSLIYGTSDGYGAPLPDEMLSGFYLMLVCQVILIAQSFTKVITEPVKDHRIDSDILDF